jgi:site-specific DNA recombinase
MRPLQEARTGGALLKRPRHSTAVDMARSRSPGERSTSCYRIYRGETVHKDKNYPGEHEALVDEALWNEVQALLASNRVDRVPGTTDRQPSLLAGILFDAQGERMTPTHATKRGTHYRYYVSRSLLAGKAKDLGQRIPAAALEALVTHRIRDWLADPAGVFQAVQDVTG